MFTIVVGQDTHSMLQSGQDVQPDLAMILILTPQGFQSWLHKDFNPDSARISILTPQGFQSWPRKDLNQDVNPDLAHSDAIA